MNTQKEKLIDILSIPIHPRIGADYTEVVADYLLDNDVLPVVRCKDCKRGKPDTICDDYTACEYWQTVMPNSGFCSYGERKEVIQK